MFSKRRTSLLALGMGLVMAACGGGGDAGTEETEGAAAGGAGAAPAAVANAGSITGTINMAGTPPANPAIDMTAEPDCAAKHPGGATQEKVVTNGGKLKNVFVYIKEGLSGTHTAPGTAVEVDQQCCVYIPHVVGVMTGQTLTFRNSDGLAHNIKSTPANNRGFNISQPTNMTSNTQFSTPEIMVPVQCDVHGWMTMYVGVTNHPYFAVSGDDGSFTIGNVPPGTYTLEAWHEQYGVKTAQVTVDPNGTATVTFDYDAAMTNAYVPLGKPIDPHGPGAHAGTHGSPAAN